MNLNTEKIAMIHGSGGAATGELIREVFAAAFHNEILDAMEDAALLPDGLFAEVGGTGRITVTTDSFVVDPIEFHGGDIGRLAVCGTVNDLLMRGSIPKYLTSAWVLETGARIEDLRRVVVSFAEAAAEAGVQVVAGDTKVVEGTGGILVNTTGIGVVPAGVTISSSGARPGDRIIVSGTLGDHHAAILSARMSIDNDIRSDVAPLTEMCRRISSYPIHSMRDVTRGGLGTVLKELSAASGNVFRIYEKAIPVRESVRRFCGLLGLDPVYMGNEGKAVAIVPPSCADEVLEIVRNCPYGEDAAIIGEVMEPTDDRQVAGGLYLETEIGGIRELDVMQGEGLPRIC